MYDRAAVPKPPPVAKLSDVDAVLAALRKLPTAKDRDGLARYGNFQKSKKLNQQYGALRTYTSSLSA